MKKMKIWIRVAIIGMAAFISLAVFEVVLGFVIISLSFVKS